MRRSFQSFSITIFSAFLFLLLGSSCSIDQQAGRTAAAPALSKGVPGPATASVPTEDYQSVVFVSSTTGSDTAGDGSAKSPLKSINHALAGITDASAEKRKAVFVAQGNYSTGTIQMKEFVDLYGGFSAGDWKRDIFHSASTLDGRKQRRVVIGANHARLDGFVVRGGRVRGKGAGILCLKTSPTISNSRFIDNQTLGPSHWRPKFIHETANDGGGIYCSDGASPTIENNVFAGNTTENGRGAAIAMDGHCGGLIIGNVIYQNTSGLNDPMRSSDGGAISIFNDSSPTIRKNVILSNRAESKNDGGGIFVALWCSPVIQSNVFVDNWAGDDAGALFVGGQEHRYDRPLDPLPPEDEFFVSIRDNLFTGNRNPSGNSGAMRFTMESRGDFSGNLVVNNGGIYFQRSEVTIRNNTILDDFLFTETKKGLKKGRIFNNVIWGDVRVLTEASVTFCNTREPYEGKGNISSPPLYEPDAVDLLADVVKFDSNRHITRVFASGARLRTGELAGRVVWAGKRWGVVRSNDEMSVEIWGELSEQMRFCLLPSYHQSAESPCVDRGTNKDITDADFEGDVRPYHGIADIGADEFVPGRNRTRAR